MLQDNETWLRKVTGSRAADDVRTPGPMIPGYFPDSLRRVASLLEFDSGDFLFQQGAAASACYRVVRGSIRLERTAITGASVIQRAEAGDWLVEPGPCDDLHESTAVAEGCSLVLAVSTRQFRIALRRNPAFACAWALEMSDAAKRLQRRVERLALPRARERIVHYLVTESDGNDGAVYLAGSMGAWAEHLGVAPETLSRVLSDLHADGRIERQGRAVRLIGKP